MLGRVVSIRILLFLALAPILALLVVSPAAWAAEPILDEEDVFYRLPLVRLIWQPSGQPSVGEWQKGIGQRAFLPVEPLSVDADADAGEYGDPAAIMGRSRASAQQMAMVFREHAGPYLSEVYGPAGAANIDEFCALVCEEAEAEGVRADVLFAQIMVETGWLQFGGQVNPEQCNFGGLGATNDGSAGATFTDVRTGLRAQVQHLKAYASTDDLNQECVDPRFDLVSRGCAPLIDDLGGKWAVPGTTYGASIRHVIDLMLAVDSGVGQ